MSKLFAVEVGSILCRRFRSCFQNVGNRARSRDRRFVTLWGTGGSLQIGWEISTPGTVRYFGKRGNFRLLTCGASCPIDEVLAYLKGNFPDAVQHNRKRMDMCRRMRTILRLVLSTYMKGGM